MLIVGVFSVLVLMSDSIEAKLSWSGGASLVWLLGQMCQRVILGRSEWIV